MKTIIIENIEVELTKKNIKNINLSIHPPNGRVKISAPKKVNDDTIREFVISKIPWIRKHQSRVINQEKLSKKEFITGEIHYFLGGKYLLNLVYTNKRPQGVEIRDKKYIDLYVRKKHIHRFTTKST